VAISIGETDIKLLSDILITIACCTRKDNEGFKLAQLRDTVYEILSVDPDTAADNFKRIPFYQSAPVLANWTQIGSLLVQNIIESEDLVASDETKFRILTVRLRAPAKV
jgi:hypothetical protein